MNDKMDNLANSPIVIRSMDALPTDPTRQTTFLN